VSILIYTKLKHLGEKDAGEEEEEEEGNIVEKKEEETGKHCQKSALSSLYTVHSAASGLLRMARMGWLQLVGSLKLQVSFFGM